MMRFCWDFVKYRPMSGKLSTGIRYSNGPSLAQAELFTRRWRVDKCCGVTVQDLASLVQGFLDAWTRQVGAKNSIAVIMQVKALKAAVALVKEESNETT